MDQYFFGAVILFLSLLRPPKGGQWKLGSDFFLKYLILPLFIIAFVTQSQNFQKFYIRFLKKYLHNIYIYGGYLQM